MFNWLFPPRKPARTQTAGAGAARADAARSARDPDGQELQAEAAPSLKRREERTARRERLYTAVRDAMTRAGVLSATYKFKVLSLDARGLQYLVMVDLALAEAAAQERLAQIEASIIEGANARYDITVKAVYWRVNDQVTPGERAAAAERDRPSRPTPLEPSRAMPASRPEQPAAARRPGSQYDPIQADEVAAFKSALAAGVARPAVAAAAAVGIAPAASAAASSRSVRQTEQSYTLLTGFEDTELPDPKLRSALSGSQYGDLN
jgi:hypothetical protein